MTKLYDAAMPLAREMMETGVEPAGAKERFSAAYGEGIYALRVHWGAQHDRKGTPVARWRATAEHDFVTGYGDEIDIYLARERALVPGKSRN